MSLITVPNKKPTNEPKPERKASFSFLSPTNSPITAPRKGPRTIPQGGKNSPATVPITHPQLPHLVPPAYFVPNIGITKSSTCTKMTNTAHTTNLQTVGEMEKQHAHVCKRRSGK